MDSLYVLTTEEKRKDFRSNVSRHADVYEAQVVGHASGAATENSTAQCLLSDAHG